VIDIGIAPDVLVCGRRTPAVVRVVNRSTEHHAYGVVVDIEPDQSIRLDAGDTRIEIDSLSPGGVHTHDVVLTGRTPGTGRLDLPYVAYRTAGRGVRPALAPIALRIAPAAPLVPSRTPTPSAAPSDALVPSVFISHRRDDSGWLGQLLRTRLASQLRGSHIFLDHDDLAAGDVWRHRIDGELRRARALLAVIGPAWEDLAERAGEPRIRQPRDVVRHEVATALRRRILVIPVLHQRDALPDPDRLPSDLRPLHDHQFEVVEPRTVKPIVRRIAVRLRGEGLR
jgi:hypothetical protein